MDLLLILLLQQPAMLKKKFQEAFWNEGWACANRINKSCKFIGEIKSKWFVKQNDSSKLMIFFLRWTSIDKINSLWKETLWDVIETIQMQFTKWKSNNLLKLLSNYEYEREEGAIYHEVIFHWLSP